MNFNNLKDLCKKHDECLAKTKIIENADKEQIWLKVVDARNNEFYLSKEEVKALTECINEKGISIEDKINEIL